jgi:putative toxin-antitoxin system antitoxin component (TIGR02293 family)
MITAQRVVSSLGGKKTFPDGVRDWDDLRRRIRSGLKYASFEEVSRRYGIGSREMGRILDLPARTLARRKQAKRFSAEESDRLVRLGRVAALADQTLGGAARATVWLHEPNRALGGEAPLDELDTEVGARQVEDLLVRVAHGLVS